MASNINRKMTPLDTFNTVMEDLKSSKVFKKRLPGMKLRNDAQFLFRWNEKCCSTQEPLFDSILAKVRKIDKEVLAATIFS